MYPNYPDYYKISAEDLSKNARTPIWFLPMREKCITNSLTKCFAKLKSTMRKDAKRYLFAHLTIPSVSHLCTPR